MWLASTVILAVCAAGAAQITGTKSPNPNITAPGPQRHGPPAQQQPQAPGTRASQPIARLQANGNVEGFVYWDTSKLTHKPAGSCSGLAITVSVGSNSGGPLTAYTPIGTLSNNFKYVGQVKEFLAGGKLTVYDVCTYGFDKVPVGPNLQVKLTVTDPYAFSPYAQPQSGILGPIQIINGQCNMLPRITNPTAADLLGHWGTCQNMAYDVNFPMAIPYRPPLTAITPPANSGGQSGILSGTPQQGMLSPGTTQSAKGNSGSLLGNQQSAPGQGGGKSNQRTGSSGAIDATPNTIGGATLMQVKPSAATRPGSPSSRQGLSNADVISLMKAGLPETAIVSKIKSTQGNFDLSFAGCSQLQQAHVSASVLNAMGGGSVRPCAGSGQQVKAPAGGMKLNPGPVIHLSTAGSQVSNAVLQNLRAQSIATHNERTALASGTQLTSNGNNRVAATSARTNLVNTAGTGQLGPGQTLDATTAPAPGGSTPPGSVPPGGTNPNGSQSGTTVNPPLQTTGNPPTTVGGSAGNGSIMQRALKAHQPISMCRFTTEPVIEAISGKLHNIVLTPDPGTGQYPNNQYTIRGCNFGQMQGHVHIYGAFINNQSPVGLGIDTWSDNLILVTFSPTFQNEYDLGNITLDVTRTDGHTVQMQGLSFYATRVSRPLARIPQSITKLPTTYLQTDDFFSPVTSGNLQSAGLIPITQPTSAAFFLFTPIWTSNATSDGYPPNRLYFGDSIDFSKLRAGFVLDPNLQTLVGKYYADSDCKYFDVVVSANMQGNNLLVGAQPAECDNYGKFVYAYYALELSVTGPKGPLLDPWPTGLQ